MTEMFGEAWSPMSVPDLAPDDGDDVTKNVSCKHLARAISFTADVPSLIKQLCADKMWHNENIGFTCIWIFLYAMLESYQN